MEWKWFDGDSYVSTFEYHEHRPRAAHLEQSDHVDRLKAAERLIRSVAPKSVVDLGCGDGGLLSLIKDIPSWGYDFHPAAEEGWKERGVSAELVDLFHRHPHRIKWGELAVVTEVLEHLENPHRQVEWIAKNATWIVASSPAHENEKRHADCHAWSWNEQGYRRMLEKHFIGKKHFIVGRWSQIFLGRSRYVD